MQFSTGTLHLNNKKLQISHHLHLQQ